MQQLEVFFIFTRPLNWAGFEYMATGSAASLFYGTPRLTHDIDLVLLLPSARISDLCNLFPQEEFYIPPPEIMRIEAQRMRRGHFNLVHHGTGYKCDVYLHTNDPLERWGLDHRRRIHFGEGEENAMWVAPPEYVIVRKLEYFREGESEKHLTDIRGILDISKDSLDSDALDRWIETRDVRKEWQRCQD